MARPSKLTEAAMNRIVAAVRAGAHPEVAAVAAGVSAKSFRRWMERGRKATRGRYRELFEAIYRAESTAEVALTVRLRKLSKRDPKVLARVLERRHPERWSPFRKLDTQEAPPSPGAGVVIVPIEQWQEVMGRANPATPTAATTPASLPAPRAAAEEGAGDGASQGAD